MKSWWNYSFKFSDSNPQERWISFWFIYHIVSAPHFPFHQENIFTRDVSVSILHIIPAFLGNSPFSVCWWSLCWAYSALNTTPSLCSGSSRTAFCTLYTTRWGKRFLQLSMYKNAFKISTYTKLFISLKIESFMPHWPKNIISSWNPENEYVNRSRFFLSLLALLSYFSKSII